MATFRRAGVTKLEYPDIDLGGAKGRLIDAGRSNPESPA
jgi:hypothetical protein